MYFYQFFNLYVIKRYYSNKIFGIKKKKNFIKNLVNYIFNLLNINTHAKN